MLIFPSSSSKWPTTSSTKSSPRPAVLPSCALPRLSSCAISSSSSSATTTCVSPDSLLMTFAPSRSPSLPRAGLRRCLLSRLPRSLRARTSKIQMQPASRLLSQSRADGLVCLSFQLCCTVRLALRFMFLSRRSNWGVFFFFLFLFLFYPFY